MVGQWFDHLANFATTWLPLAFFALVLVTVWLLWKTAGMMPRTKPANMVRGTKSQLGWADVAGVEEVRAELMEVVDFFRDPKRFERLGAKVPKGLAPLRPAGYRQDAARQGGRARVRRELLQRLGLLL